MTLLFDAVLGQGVPESRVVLSGSFPRSEQCRTSRCTATVANFGMIAQTTANLRPEGLCSPPIVPDEAHRFVRCCLLRGYLFPQRVLCSDG